VHVSLSTPNVVPSRTSLVAAGVLLNA